MKRFLFFVVIALVVWTALTAKAQINTPSTAAVPFGSNSSYAYGIMPTNLPASGTYGKGTEVAAKYNAWKSAYVENCGSNMARVKFDDQSQTVSEGIGYGMLLAAYAADQDLFNRLWAYYKNFRNGNGVMHWKISGCNSVVGQNGATDAELDAAMALVVASKQWPNTTSPHNYKTDAVALINAIKNFETNASDYTFENGDAWKPSCRNPSYQAPGYARVFKLFMAENGQANNAFWDNVITKTEALFTNNAHSSSGLATNWCLPTGVPNSSCSGSGTAPDKFGYDACRAPWRQSVDYIWFGPSAMQTITNRQAAYWINRGGAGSVQGGDGINWDGSGNGDHNAAFVGPIGALSLSTSSTTANQNFCNALYTENKNDALATGYFTKILQMIGLFVQSGNFWNPYGTSVTPASTSITLTAPTTLTATEGDVITISANATATTGSISKVDFYVNGTLVGTDNSSPYSISWTANTTGSVSVTATATNSNSDVATTAATVMTIYKAINQTGTAPTIDGTIDALWSQNNSASITKLINGTAPSSSSDLSASYKALWDNTYVYVLVDVNDNTLVNNSGTDVYNDDAVEVFFDIGNSKGTTYGTNDVQYTFRWNDATVTANNSRPTTGITFSMVAKTGGYVLEARIPWSTLSGTPAVNQLVGFEVEVNDDDDGGNRDHKLAWNATVDDTWQNPSYMGTAKLVGLSCTTPGAAGTITGSASVCRSATGITYSISSVSGATGYNWTLPSGFTITAGSNTNAITVSTNSTAASGTISVTPTNTCGNGTAANFTVTANATVTPSVAIAASATTICAGASVTFTATPTNGGTPTYQWYNGTTAITNATSSTYTTTGLANGNQISVRMVSNAACASTTSAVTSNTVTMTVNATVTPSVAIAASATTICTGSSVTFTATPTNGGTAPTYQWYNGANAVSGATSSTYTTTGLTNGNQISVRMVSNAACASTTSAVTSNTVTMTVTSSVTPSVAIAASSTTICTGTSVTFTATPTNGGAAPTYQWYNGANAVSGATSSTYTTTGLTNGNQISVRMVSNAACASTTSAVTSNTVTMTVTSSVTPSVAIAASSTTICTGTSVTFTATPTNGGAPTYQWYNGTTAITNATSSTYTTTGLANGNQISVRMVSNAACASTTSAVTSNTVTMTVTATVTPSVAIAASATTICTGSSVTFTATPTNGGAAPTYQWYNGTTAITSATSSTYTTTGLANGNQISVRMVSNASCASTTSAVSSNTVTMTVNATVTPSVAIAASATTICTGSSVTFTATPTNGGAAPTYQWYNGTTAITSATSSTYTTTGLANGNQISVRMVSNASCASTTSAVSSNTVTMTVNATVTPSVAIAASATTICTGSSVTFTATPTNGGAAPTYQWYNGTTAITNATSSTYTTTGLANGNQISVRMVSNATCRSTSSAVSSNTVTMTVTSSVTPSVSIATSSSTICSGSSVTFTATPTNGGAAPTYQWYNGTTAITNATSSTYTTTGLANGNQISVRMVSNASCRSTSSAVTSNTVTMTVNASTGAAGSITGSSNIYKTSTGIQFSIAAVSGATSYNWTLPTGFTITSGAGTRTITVSVSSTATNGTVSVTPVGNCGNGAASSLTVTVSTPAGFSTSMTGPATVTSGQNSVTYSVPDQSGMTYTWTVPPGATIVSGQGTSSIVVDFGSSTSGSVTVTETNQANQSNSISKTITVSTATSVRPESENGLVSLYPNPTEGVVTLKNKGAGSIESIQYVLIDAKGVKVAEGQVDYLDNGVEIHLPVASGVYLMMITIADKHQVITVVKQ
ncbi:MAG: glycosyl hydrolase family 8 [Cytophagaceae bacterium]